MKTLTLTLIPFLLATASHKTIKQPANDPTLTKLTYSFHTNDDDKDWDTQVGAQITLNGHLIAERFCCSADRKHDHWNDHSESPVMPLTIIEKITKNQLNGASYVVSIQANGSDKWNFDARLHAEFNDGTQRDWTFLTHSLNSRHNQRVSNTFALSDHHRP